MPRSLRHRLTRRGVRVPWFWAHIPALSPLDDRLRALALGNPCTTVPIIYRGRTIPVLIR